MPGVPTNSMPFIYAAVAVLVSLVVGTLLLVIGGIVKGVTHKEDDGGLGAGDWLMITGGIIIALVFLCVPTYLIFGRRIGL